jgi:pyrroloquinoline-quinone synthase
MASDPEVLMSRDLITILDEMTAERSLLRHPFYNAWTAGELPLERLRNYAVRYYPHVEAFPRYLSAIHSRCTNLATRQALLENLIEEERGAENHPELWLRFAEALGVSRETVTEAAPTQAANQLVDTFTDLASNAPLAAGLAALYVYESQIPAIASAKIDGLRRFYGLTEPRGLAFFDVHQRADRMHAETDAALIDRHATGDPERIAAIHGADRALTSLWAMLDAV